MSSPDRCGQGNLIQYDIHCRGLPDSIDVHIYIYTIMSGFNDSMMSGFPDSYVLYVFCFKPYSRSCSNIWLERLLESNMDAEMRLKQQAKKNKIPKFVSAQKEKTSKLVPAEKEKRKIAKLVPAKLVEEKKTAKLVCGEIAKLVEDLVPEKKKTSKLAEKEKRKNLKLAKKKKNTLANKIRRLRSSRMIAEQERVLDGCRLIASKIAEHLKHAEQEIKEEERELDGALDFASHIAEHLKHAEQETKEGERRESNSSSRERARTRMMPISLSSDSE